MIVVTSKALFQLTDIEQIVGADSPAKLAHKGDMLGDIPRELAKLGIVLYETFHVCD